MPEKKITCKITGIRRPHCGAHGCGADIMFAHSYNTCGAPPLMQNLHMEPCSQATPKNVGDGTYMDGNMDVGLLPDESEMLNLKVPGEPPHKQ